MYVVNNKLGCFGKGAPATACVYLKALLCILFFFRLLDGLNTEVRVIIKAELLVNTFWCKWEKTQKQQFPLNMSNFYLASELPRGENCHILAVDVLPFFFFFWMNLCHVRQVWWCGGSPKSAKSCWGQTVGLGLRYGTSTSEQRRSPMGPAEATDSSTRAAAAFSSDKCTSEWQNHKKERRKKKQRCALASTHQPAA